MNQNDPLFETLERINERPEPYSKYTADALWTSPDISEMMLRYHLDGEVDLASRKTSFISTSAEWIRSEFELGPGKRVLDLGCGPGLYANRLARSGARVTGVDFSERSIAHARKEAEKEGLTANYVVSDYLTFDTEDRFDLAILIMCDYCALSPEQRGRLLERVRMLLKADGAFLFDVYSAAFFETWDERAAYGRGLMDDFWSARDYYGFLNTFKYDDEKLVLERYHIVETDREIEYYNWFQHFDVDSLSAELDAAGFSIDRTLGDVAGKPFDTELDEFAVVAKPTTE